MSRAYKDAQVAANAAVTGLSAAQREQLSGADLEQLRLARLNNAGAVATPVSGVPRKDLGTSTYHNKSSAGLSGADLERGRA